MKKPQALPSPYNFVPLGPVHYPAWGEQVSHDIPFQKSLSGRINLRLRACTPLIIGSAQNDQGVRHLPMLRGKPFVPGSSVRGMLRNVLEIATFSRMNQVNDHKFGIRDLTNSNLYGQHMAALVKINGKSTTFPLVSSGWLYRNTDQNHKEFPATEFPAYITPCSFAKIEYEDLIAVAKRRSIQHFDPKKRQSSPDKYSKWFQQRNSKQVRLKWKSLQIGFECETNEKSNPSGKVPRKGAYGGRVTSISGKKQGSLVFTGQPQEKRPNQKNSDVKHHDFVFYDATTERMYISRRMFDDFHFVHKGSGERHRLTDSANDELKFWLNQSNWERGYNNLKIPVFFLLNKDKDLRALGLAQMFRLAYDNSIADLIRNSQPPEDQFDMSELIFGYTPSRGGSTVPDSIRNRSLRGRVIFGNGHLHGKYHELKEQMGVLGGPKASFYPNYIEQSNGKGATGEFPVWKRLTKRDPEPVYKTYMDEDSRIRGWKGYIKRESIIKPLQVRNKHGQLSHKVHSKWKAIELNPDAYFDIPLVFHNLKPEELGAVLWCLDFGERSNCFHGLGMAKSLGYGRVQLEIGKIHIQSWNGSQEEELSSSEHLDEVRQLFKEYMNEESFGSILWEDSREIFELLRLASIPEDATFSDSDPFPSKFRHIMLKPPKGRNEFIEAKTRGSVLRPLGAKTYKPKITISAKDKKQAILKEIATIEPSNAKDKIESILPRAKQISGTFCQEAAQTVLNQLSPKFKKKKAGKAYMKLLLEAASGNVENVK